METKNDVSTDSNGSESASSRIRSRLREVNLGRVEEPKRDNQERIAGTGETDATGSGTASVGNTGESPQGTGNTASNTTRKSASSRKAAKDHEQAATVGEETAAVETEVPKPRRGRPPGSGRKSKGAIQPEHIEAWTVQAFSFIAMIKNAKHWAVADPNVEVKPWAPAAAELLNKIPQKYAEQAITANAAVAVVVGIGSMVYVRSMQDMYMKQAAKPHTNVEQSERENIPEPTPIKTQERTRKGTGADTVHPNEKIAGLGETAAF